MISLSIRLPALSILIGLTCMLWPARLPAQTAGTLPGEMEKLAGQIKTFLTASKMQTINVRPFQRDPQLAASAGPGLQKQLIDALAKEKVTQDPNAVVSCEGTFTFIPRQKAVVIQTRLLSKNGGPGLSWTPLKVAVKDIEDIVAITGATGALSVADPQQRERDLAKAVTKPEVNLQPGPSTSPPASGPSPAPGQPAPRSQASAAPLSPFAVELCRKDPQTGVYIPIPLKSEQGMAFGELALSDVYGILVHNRETFPVAVRVTIDGLNLFAISKVPGYRDFGKLILPPGKSHLIKGWHFEKSVVRQFEVRQLPDALAAQINPGKPVANPEAVGTITVGFHAAAIGPEGVLPKDEPEILSLATAAGLPVDENHSEVLVKAIGKLRQAVSIRYTKANDLPPGEAPALAK